MVYRNSCNSRSLPNKVEHLNHCFSWARPKKVECSTNLRGKNCLNLGLIGGPRPPLVIVILIQKTTITLATMIWELQLCVHWISSNFVETRRFFNNSNNNNHPISSQRSGSQTKTFDFAGNYGLNCPWHQEWYESSHGQSNCTLWQCNKIKSRACCYNAHVQQNKWDEELVLHGRGCDNNNVKQKRGSTWGYSSFLATVNGRRRHLTTLFFIQRLCGWMNVVPHDWGSVVHWLHSSSRLSTRASIRPGPALCWLWRVHPQANRPRDCASVAIIED